jgi:hypothetical protein
MRTSKLETRNPRGKTQQSKREPQTCCAISQCELLGYTWRQTLALSVIRDMQESDEFVECAYYWQLQALIV